MELHLILRNFLNPEGKLTGFPAKRKMKIYALVCLSRNCFQFFTIPVGCFLGGLLVDQVFEPVMSR